MGTSLGTIIHI